MPENETVPEGDQPLLRATGLVLVMNTPKGRSAEQSVEAYSSVTVTSICLAFPDFCVSMHRTCASLLAMNRRQYDV